MWSLILHRVVAVPILFGDSGIAINQHNGIGGRDGILLKLTLRSHHEPAALGSVVVQQAPAAAETDISWLVCLGLCRLQYTMCNLYSLI